MSILSHSSLPPCTTCPGAGWPGAIRSKRFWIRLNRLLAWSIVASPVAQIALGTRLLNGLLLDLVLLLVHGALSLALFGIPKAAKEKEWMVWLGWQPAGLSARNDFLMTGWRIALVLPYTALAFAIASPLNWVLAIPAIGLGLRLPFSVLGHVDAATAYAARRWGLPDDQAQSLLLGFIVAALFAAAGTLNLLR